jgi:soluble lytic murein transglycosylase-like protein
MLLEASFSRLRGASKVIACLFAFLVGAFLDSLPAQASESISAYVDADGRVIFVNDDSEPGAGSGATAPADTEPSGKILASTSPASPANRVARAAAARLAGPPNREPAGVNNFAGPPPHLDTMILQAAAQHQIDPDLVRAIVRVESGFNPNAVSPAGAHGLMQLIPATARRFGVANPFDPRANLDGGIRYLKHLLGLYKGDLQLALAAYNAGENSVARYRGVPAFRETQNYIRKIGVLYPLGNVAAGFRPAPRIVKFVDPSGVVHYSNTDVP